MKGGRYEIERLIRAAPGKDVYLARDHVLDCSVVIDVVPDHAPTGGQVTAWETRVLGRLGDHPNIATVIDHWPENGSSFMVSRYLPGGSLQQLIDAAEARGEQLPLEQILEYSMAVAHALEHIHKRRIVHRDLQPRNVILDNWGSPRLVDFDTSISLEDSEAPPISDGRSIEHMAPELVAGQVPGQTADLYSLGTTMYAMCTGRPPYPGTREEIIAGQSNGVPVPERTDLPEGLKTLVSKLLALRPEDRPASATEVVQRLEELVAAQSGLEALLTSEESATLEFKASLRVPIGPPPPDMGPRQIQRELEHAAIKTIAAFLNTRGGTLVIGADDRGTVVGIEVDFPCTKGSRDGWRRTFDDLVSNRLGSEVLAYIDLQLVPAGGRTVAIVTCQARDEPTWLDDEFFVRRTASTERLNPRHAWAWCREHWRTPAQHPA